MSNCPRCGSPRPYMHPTVQYGGEVNICPHPWHDPIVGHVVDPSLPAVHDPDQANLAAVLDEQALLGLRAELLDLIAKEFHAEGNKLICNRCDQVVTWVTKHCRERHGDDVQVWILPEHLECEQLW